MTTPPKVAILMGSKSDFPTMSAAVDCLREFAISSHIEVISAHRTAEKMLSFAKTAESNGFQLIIAGAGGAAHLPGMLAALTILPVIGVPVISSKLGGIDSLLSIAQMPKGVPVATVAIEGAWNAGLLAVQILALSDPSLAKKLRQFKTQQKLNVKQMNQELRILTRKAKGSAK